MSDSETYKNYIDNDKDFLVMIPKQDDAQEV